MEPEDLHLFVTTYSLEKVSDSSNQKMNSILNGHLKMPGAVSAIRFSENKENGMIFQKGMHR